MKKLSLLLVLICFIFCGCSKPVEAPVVKTPELEQIRSICNLATLECYYHNVAKSTKEAGTGISGWFEKERKFWIEYTGIAKIGIDMSDVNMTIEGQTVTITLPEAKLLDIDINQDSLSKNSYISDGDSKLNSNKITAEDQTKAINDAQEEMSKSVMSNKSLLLTAQSRAKDLIENYIKRLGELSNIEYSLVWVSEETK